MHEKLDSDKKVLAGGDIVEVRGLVVIVDVASNDELDQLLMNLPGWGLMNISVTPLQNFRDRIELSRKMLERFKAAGSRRFCTGNMQEKGRYYTLN